MSEDIRPAERTEELLVLLGDVPFEVHHAGDSDEEYAYLTEDNVCITVLDPHQDKKLFIDLDSVLPAYQRQGIGLALIAEGHRIAKELGFPYSVVLGHAGYYPKAGYRPASRLGIKPPFEVADENFMALQLDPAAKELCGTIRYDEAFGL